jgi:hypothetical protein
VAADALTPEGATRSYEQLRLLLGMYILTRRPGEFDGVSTPREYQERIRADLKLNPEEFEMVCAITWDADELNLGIAAAAEKGARESAAEKDWEAAKYLRQVAHRFHPQTPQSRIHVPRASLHERRPRGRRPRGRNRARAPARPDDDPEPPPLAPERRL